MERRLGILGRSFYFTVFILSSEHVQYCFQTTTEPLIVTYEAIPKFLDYAVRHHEIHIRAVIRPRDALHIFSFPRHLLVASG